MAVQSKNENVRSLAFGSMTNSYADVGAETLHPIWQITVQNTTDVLLVVSKDDGATDWLRIPASTSGVWDYLKDSGSGQIGLIPKGTQFQVKHETGSAPTEGELNISVEYLVRYE